MTAVIRNLAVLAAVSMAACGVTPTDWQFHRDLLDVDRLADDGHHAEAEAGYLALSDRAERDDLLRYTWFRIGLMRERSGDYAGALEQYAELYTRPYSLYDEVAANALFRSAGIVGDVIGDIPEAMRMYSGLLRMFPNTAYADDSLAAIEDHAMQNEGPLAYLEFIADIYDGLANTELADNLVYRSARVLHEQVHDYNAAIEMYQLLAVRFHRSGFWDDAPWYIAECYRLMGDIDAEYTILETFILGREVSWVMADYDSGYYPDTIRRMAAIHEEREEWSEAIAIWRHFQRIFSLSLQVDDIQFRVIELQSYMGDVAAMRDSLEWLEDNYPLSRHIAPAADLIASTSGR